MRKNLFALAIAGILAVSTMAPTMVSAASTPTPQEYQTPVSYKYKDTSMTFDGFTVTVPAALNLTSDNADIKDKVTVTMEQNRTLPTGKAIVVQVKSKNSYKLYKSDTGVADGTNDPEYELKAKKEGNAPDNDMDTVNWGAVTAFTKDANLQKVAEFVAGDFTTTNGPASKNAWLNAKITKKPQVGLDNQNFTDILTFQVSVGDETPGT